MKSGYVIIKHSSANMRIMDNLIHTLNIFTVCTSDSESRLGFEPYYSIKYRCKVSKFIINYDCDKIDIVKRWLNSLSMVCEYSLNHTTIGKSVV